MERGKDGKKRKKKGQKELRKNRSKKTRIQIERPTGLYQEPTQTAWHEVSHLEVHIAWADSNDVRKILLFQNVFETIFKN